MNETAEEMRERLILQDPGARMDYWYTTIEVGRILCRIAQAADAEEVARYALILADNIGQGEAQAAADVDAAHREKVAALREGHEKGVIL